MSHLIWQTVPILLELLHCVVRGHRQLVGVVAHHVREHVLQRKEYILNELLKESMTSTNMFPTCMMMSSLDTWGVAL